MLVRRLLGMIVFSIIILSGVVQAQQPAAPVSPQPGVVGPQPQPPALSQQQQTGTLPSSPQPTVASPPGQGPPSLKQLTPQQAETFQKLFPEQWKAVETELSKTGGILTPEAKEALKARPEFKGLTPEDIQKGKEILEKKEKEAEKKEPEKKESEKKEPDKKEPPDVAEKKVVGEEPREKTLFERYRQISKYQEIETALKPFGYEFFMEAAVRVLTDRKDIPVPSKYVIGPGDEVKLLFWGRVNAQYNLIVERNGNITIPQIGPVQVAGMTFDRMAAHLMKQSEQIVGANIDITMGALKTIPVFVLGDVRRPGSYTIGSFATLTDALLTAGGPTSIGSMRNVQLRRNDQLITVFDLYDFFLRGDKSKDKTLQAGDIVFVPITGPLVGIAGNVKRPAIYELKGEHNLSDVFDLAGGIIPTAYTQQIQVERIIKSEKQIVADIDDKNLMAAKSFLLQDADLVKVFSIVDKDVNAIYLNGNVKRPGKYEFKPGMRVKDLVKDSTELLPETYFEYALIKRLNPPGLEAFLIPFNPGKLLLMNDLANNIELKAQDNVYIFSKWLFKDKPFFTVEGEVRNGGKFDLSENMTVKDAILTAGDLSKEAYMRKGQIIRVNQNREFVTVYFNVAKALAGQPEENLSLQNEDKIIIHSLWEERWKEKVSISGEVKKPVEYLLTESMTISDLVFKAGGLTRDSYLAEAELYRTDWRTKEITLHRFNLKKALENDPAHNFQLKDLDRIVIHSVWELWDQVFSKNVFLEGEVAKGGKYEHAENMKINDLIFKAGGLTKDSYMDEAELYRTDWKTKEVTLQRFNLRKALENDPAHNFQLKDLDRIVVHSIWETVYRKSVSVEGDVAKPGKYQYAERMTVKDLVFAAGNVLESAFLDEGEISSQILEDGKGVKLEHRTLNLRKVLQEDPVHNVLLKPYDRLYVKRIPEWGKEKFANIAGEVQLPGKYIIKKGERLSSLIERAAGFTPLAYLPAALFTRLSVRKEQEKRIKQFIEEQELEIIKEAALMAEGGFSKDEAEQRQKALAQRKEIITRLKAAEVTGRIVIRIASLEKLKGTEYDLELEDGDSLDIPMTPSAVMVMGRVYNSTAILFTKGKPVEYYLEKVGGPAENADKKRIYLVKADGSVISRTQEGLFGFRWDPESNRWASAGFMSTQVGPGDAILVPEKYERTNWTRELKDWAQIIFQTAVGAGVVKALYK